MDNRKTAKITDWRIVAVSGDTADGRNIPADTLREIAEQYDPQVYGARINLEHLRFIFPEYGGGYGDVLELRAEPWEKDESKTALLAKLSVLPELEDIWASGQKIYTSIEIIHDFADTGRAYLGGLAITDSPASLGTTANFSRAKAASPETVFSAYQLSDLAKGATMTTDAKQPETVKQGLDEATAESIFSRVLSKFIKQAEQPSQPEAAPEDKPTNEAHFAQQVAELAQVQKVAAQAAEQQAQAFTVLQAELTALQEKFAALESRLENEAVSGERTPHAGTAPSVSW